jgi:hypothetical protein
MATYLRKGDNPEELSSAECSDCAYQCLVDKDMDHWFNAVRDVRNLVWTNFNDLLLSFAERIEIENLLVFVCRAKFDDFETTFISMIHVLRSLYALKLAARSLSLSLRWIPFASLLNVNSGNILFDDDEYAKRLLNANAKADYIDKLRATAQEFKSKMDCEDRDAIRGHDLLVLLSWVVRQFRGLNKMADPDVLERHFVAIAVSQYNRVLQLLATS